MIKADLHIHSTVSDGTDSIERIIQKAVDKGLDAIALTEHDTLAHKKYIPKTCPIKVLAAIEISAIDVKKGIKAHILGYNIQETALVEALTLPTLWARHELTLKQIAILNANGYDIDVNALNKADNTYYYKQHILEFLLHTKQIDRRFGHFYQSTFKNNGICAMEIDYVDVQKAVTAIKDAGGKAVLAHAGQQKNFYLIDELVPLGLDGLEYDHAHNSEQDKAILTDYAKKYQLFLTGGSDYHGLNNTIPLDIGDFLSPQSGVTALI